MKHHIKVHFNNSPTEVLAHEAFISINDGSNISDSILIWKFNRGKPVFNLHIIENSIGTEMREPV